ncbi:MAG: hypothetical protein ACC707_17385 [Thiohalomonadales bacterium]
MVKFGDLEMAFDFVSFDTQGDHEAFLCIRTGKIYYSSDSIDDEQEECKRLINDVVAF